MIFLEDLEVALQKECKRRSDNGDNVDSDEVLELFQKAGRELLIKQVIHSDGQRKSIYRLIVRHKDYFEILLNALGYHLKYDATYEYLLLLPGQDNVGSVRGQIKKDETLMLFALRVMWEEGSRDGEMDDLGRILVDTSMLIDRFITLGGREIPKKSRIKEMLTQWKSRGYILLGEEDQDEEVFPVEIRPVIRDLVTADLAEEVIQFLDNPPANGDVLTAIDDKRAADQAASTVVEEPTSDTAPSDDLFGSNPVINGGPNNV